MHRSYPSKLLLLGEYTIIQRSAALAMPYPYYETTWSDSVSDEQIARSTLSQMGSQTALNQILAHVRQLETPRLDIKSLQKDLDKGLWLLSNAPIGYGLGSSGTVCAALYDRYALVPTEDRAQLQQELAQVEHSFHGKSSGIDPLVSYLHKALHVHPNGYVETVQLPPHLPGVIFLVDTQTPRVSTPMIEFFLAQSQQDAFVNGFVRPTSAAVEVALEAWLDSDFDTLYMAAQHISALQLEHLPPMVLPEWRDAWQHGLETQDYCLKLCGAGGGGFWLGFAPTWEQVLQHFDPRQVQRVF